MMYCVQCGQPLVECRCSGWEAIGLDTYDMLSSCGFYAAPTSGKWKWDAATNTWLQDEEVPPVNEIYAAPETPKLTPEAEQARLWDLLKQAAGG